MSLRKDAVLLVKNLTDAADALLNKAGNWGGKDRLRAVLKKIKKDVSKCVSLNVTCYTPLHSIFSLRVYAKYARMICVCVVRLYLSCTVHLRIRLMYYLTVFKQLSQQTLLHVLLV